MELGGHIAKRLRSSKGLIAPIISTKLQIPKNSNSIRNFASQVNCNNNPMLMKKTWYQQLLQKQNILRISKRGFASSPEGDVIDEEIQNVLKSMQIEDTFSANQQQPKKPAADLSSLLRDQIFDMKKKGMKAPLTLADAKRDKDQAKDKEMEDELLEGISLLRKEHDPTIDSTEDGRDSDEDYALFMDWKSFDGVYPVLFWDTAVVSESVSEITELMKQDGIPQKMSIWDLRYLSLYPLKVRNWVRDAKTPRGFWNMHGLWEDTGIPILPLNAEERKPELKFNPDQSDLPEDLRGQYRFGIRPEEIESYPEKLKEFLSFRYATPHEVFKFRIRKCIENYQYHWRDTGSSAVQVGIMTERIRVLAAHLAKHPKDKQTAYGMNRMIGKRFRMMKYLRYRDTPKYFQVLKGHGLRDIPIAPKHF